MGIFDRLKAQINPFDNGATWSNPKPVQRQASPPVNRPPSRNIPINVGMSDPVQQSTNIGNINQGALSNNPIYQDMGPQLRRGSRVLDTASNYYNATPEFKNIVSLTKPSVVGQSESVEGLNGAKAAGIYYPSNNRRKNGRIWVNDTNDNEDTMFHEGLHASWDKMSPLERASYLRTAQRSLPANRTRPAPVPLKPGEAGIRAYLMSRTDSYKGRQGNTKDITSMNPSIQNEIHSFIPEYYEMSKEDMPQELQNYYSRYYKPGSYKKTKNIVRDISAGSRMRSSIFNLINGE
jgi:hypothetical protein